MQWADGRKSWIKEANLPEEVLENLKLGQRGNQQKMVSLNEFGQKRIEFHKLVTQSDKGNGLKHQQMVKR